MITAAVGYQCPDCVASGAVGVRTARTVAGGRVVTGRPVVTYSLIGITVGVFLVQLARGIDVLAIDFGMWPAGIVAYGEWWRLFTSAFLHGSFLHIAFNMLVLFMLGPALERILGHGRYLLLYLIAALGGSVASFVLSDPRTVSVGASGAIFGLMGALIVAGRRLRHDVTQVIGLLAVNVVIGFIAPGVDWRAHLGGLAVGAAVAAVLVFTPPVFDRSRVLWQVLGILAILLVLALITMWRVGQLGVELGIV